MRPARVLAVTVITRILSPFVPSRKMLPFMWWLHRIEGLCEPELLYLNRFSGSMGIAIDIGSNWGSYTYPLSKRFQRVYAFEINDQTTDLLEKYKGENIKLVHCGLSSTAGKAMFHVPVMHGRALTGWGSLYRDNLPEAEKFLEKEVQVAPLDDFGITGIGFMKIDVEGHEVEVLKGAAATIKQSRPVILIEVKYVNSEMVDSWFLDLNYRRCSLDDVIGVPGQVGNHIYVPNERLVQLGING